MPRVPCPSSPTRSGASWDLTWVCAAGHQGEVESDAGELATISSLSQDLWAQRCLLGSPCHPSWQPQLPEQPRSCECHPFQHSAAPRTQGKLACAGGGWEKNSAGPWPGVLGEAPLQSGLLGFTTRGTSGKMHQTASAIRCCHVFKKHLYPCGGVVGPRHTLWVMLLLMKLERSSSCYFRYYHDNTDLAQVAQVPTWL